MKYNPLSFTVELTFLDENEDEIEATIIIVHKDCGTDGADVTENISFISSDPYDAVDGALQGLFNGGDLGDLFWPLQSTP